MWVYGGRSEAETRSRGLSRGASFIEHGEERNTASRLRRDRPSKKAQGYSKGPGTAQSTVALFQIAYFGRNRAIA